jgi:hypothetical protein
VGQLVGAADLQHRAGCSDHVAAAPATRDPAGLGRRALVGAGVDAGVPYQNNAVRGVDHGFG